MTPYCKANSLSWSMSTLAEATPCCLKKDPLLRYSPIKPNLPQSGSNSLEFWAKDSTSTTPLCVELNQSVLVGADVLGQGGRCQDGDVDLVDQRGILWDEGLR